MDAPPVIPDLTLLRRIGAGSYGDVWLARTLTGVYRAVKLVDRARFPDDRPFQRELEGISRFQRSAGDQPRQLALMHVGRIEERGLLYYVMELADDVAAGTDIDPATYEPLTFKSLLARRPRLAATECVRLGVELARGLAGLHAVGLIHRDVKPSNIILVGGMPKLADIGLVSSREASVTSLGTPGYSPPEGSGSLSADLWGLGRILYELVTGLSTREFPRLPTDLDRREDARILLELNEVVLRACEPNTKDRYPSAQAMLDDLLLIQAGRSVKDLKRLRERLRVLARGAAIAAAAALVVIAGLGVKNYLMWRELAAQEAAARQTAEENERLARYTANLHTAQLTINAGDPGLARAALRRDLPANRGPDVRGPEWHALWNETAGDADRTYGEVGGAPIWSLAVSPDGRFLAAQEGASTRTTVLWDRPTGARRVLAADTFRLGGFTADGTALICGLPGTGAATIVIATGQVTPVPAMAQLRFQKAVGDGRRVIMTQDAVDSFRLSVWDVLDGTELSSWSSATDFPNVLPNSETVSEDGRLLAVSLHQSDAVPIRRELVVWDFENNRYRFRRSDLARPVPLCFSPDGAMLALAGPGLPVTLLDANDGHTIRELPGHSGQVWDLAFSRDGQRLVSTGGDGTLRMWDVATGASRGVLRGHEAAVGVARWDAAGERLFSGSEDGTVREWRFPTDPRMATLQLRRDGNGGIELAPDGSYLVTTSADGDLQRFDTRTFAPVGARWPGFIPLYFDDQGRLHAAHEDGRVSIIDPVTGAGRPDTWQIEQLGQLTQFVFSRDRRRAMLGRADGAVQFRDLATGQSGPADTTHHQRPIWAASLSSDGRLGATGDKDGTVWIWNPSTGESVHRLPGVDSPVLNLEFSPDGNWLVVGRSDGTFTAYDTATWQVRVVRTAHARGTSALGFAADGRRLASGGVDGLVIVWSVPEFRELAVLTVQPQAEPDTEVWIGSVVFNDPADVLLAWQAGGLLRRWDLRETAAAAPPVPSAE